MLFYPKYKIKIIIKFKFFKKMNNSEEYDEESSETLIDFNENNADIDNEDDNL